ncbi:MAG TPA: hypothetical protein VF058_00995 [Actinomycetota bacterium]
MGITRVRSEAVWGHLRVLFTGAALLFLINIWFGFDNALTSGGIPRWQALIHLHAGSIGWITLSAIGIGIWVFTGSRVVSREYERRVGLLVWTAVLVFAGYIPNFWLGFSRGDGPLVALLPVFGSLAVIVLWVSAIFVLRQLRHQEVVTTVHILASAALLVAAIGATMGALLGLERVIGEFLPIADPDRVGVHAAMMDTYLFLVAAAIIEWAITLEARRWTRPGLAQGLAWGVAATLVPLGFLLDLLDQLLPVFGLLLLLGLVLFLGRVAWRALAIGPGAEDPTARWAFFGTAWLLVFLGLFLYAVSTGGEFDSLPSWFGAAFVHAGFVGMMTNLILGVLSARTRERRHVVAWGEPAALWTINLGLVLFLTLEIAADVRIGALVMGVGVLLGVGTMLLRLGASQRTSQWERVA